VNLQPVAYVYQMPAPVTPNSGKKPRARAIRFWEEGDGPRRTMNDPIIVTDWELLKLALAEGVPCKVEGFEGDFRFLSNFFAAPLEVERITFPTVEHAYQAAKTPNRGERQAIKATGYFRNALTACSYACCSRRVIGPGSPAPTWLYSTSRTGSTSDVVPVRNNSDSCAS